MRSTSRPVGPSRSTTASERIAARALPASPSARSTAKPLGLIWMPAPASARRSACSRTVTRAPVRASATAAASPPMPPPRTVICRPSSGVMRGSFTGTRAAPGRARKRQRHREPCSPVPL